MWVPILGLLSTWIILLLAIQEGGTRNTNIEAVPPPFGIQSLSLIQTIHSFGACSDFLFLFYLFVLLFGRQSLITLDESNLFFPHTVLLRF